MIPFLFPLVLFTVLFLVLKAVKTGKRALTKLSHLPFVGLRKPTWRELVKTRFKNAKDFNVTVEEAFKTHSSRGKACVIPTIGNELIALPPEELEWIISQPDNVLNAYSVQEDALQLKWTTIDPFISQTPIHREIVKRDLTRKLGELTTDIIDELAASIDEEWGTDTSNWKEVRPFPSLMRVIARTSNRVFVGLPLCRDSTLLENGKGFATALPMSAFVLRQLPPWLRPALAPIITRKAKRYSRNFIERIRPTIVARQASLRKSDQEKVSEPNDFLQWMIHAAAQSDDPRQSDPFTLGARLLNINFAAIHTSTFSITNAIFDIVSPPSSQQVISELRCEVDSVLAAHNNVWTKQGLSQLVKLDSALRESSRLGSFLAVGLVRRVLIPEGLVSPISKTYLPQGSNVCVLTTNIHTSESNYSDATTYKPFRFADVRSTAPSTSGNTKTNAMKSSSIDDPPPPYEEHSPSGGTPADHQQYLSNASLSFVTTSPTYHPFGHGRHACPGRFFAANELKLLLAYLVQNYEFEMLDARPKNQWRGTTVLPPMAEKIRVRRRKT